MKRLIPTVCLMVLLLSKTGVWAEASQQPEHRWKHVIVTGLSLTQVAFDNWGQGGEDALAWAASGEGKHTRDLPKTNWATSYKLAFGQTKLGSQSIRKTDDKIDLETIFTYKLGAYVNPYAAATLKTQFAKGYVYGDADQRTAVSKLLDPAYLSQSVGAGYQPIEQVKTRLGLAVREILTSEFTGYSDDKETAKVEKTKVDGGLESVTNLDWKLAENVLFTSKLELFAPFGAMDEVTARNDNTLSAKVSNYVTVNLNVQLISDKAATPHTQIKETLSLGLSYTLL